MTEHSRFLRPSRTSSSQSFRLSRSRNPLGRSVSTNVDLDRRWAPQSHSHSQSRTDLRRASTAVIDIGTARAHEKISDDMTNPNQLKFPIPDGFFPQITLTEREMAMYKYLARDKLAALMAMVEESDKLYEWTNIPTAKGTVVQEAHGSGVRMSDKSEYHFTLLKSSIEMRGITVDRILEAIAKSRTKEYRNMMLYLHGSDAMADARTLFKFPLSKREQEKEKENQTQTQNQKDNQNQKEDGKTTENDNCYRAIKWFAWRPRVRIEGQEDDLMDFSFLEYAGKLRAPTGANNAVAYCMQESIVRGRDVPPLTAFSVQRASLTKCGIIVSKTSEDNVLRVTSFAHIDDSTPPQMHEAVEDMLREYVGGVQRLHGLVGSFHVDGLAILSQSRWVNKRQRKTCAICGSGFTFHRKHNCRCCGEVVCSQCAPVHEVDAAVDGNTAEFRVCILCVEKTAGTTMNPRLRRKPSATLSDRLLFRKPSQITRSRSDRNSSERDSDSWSQLERVETSGMSDFSSSHISNSGNPLANSSFGETMLGVQFQQEIANLRTADAKREAEMATLREQRDMMSTRVLELEEAAGTDVTKCIENDVGVEPWSVVKKEEIPVGKLRMEDLDLDDDHTPETRSNSDASSRLRSSLQSLSATIAELRKENDTLSVRLQHSNDGKDVLEARIQVLEEALAGSTNDNEESLRKELLMAQEQLETLTMETSHRLSSSQNQMESLQFTIERQSHTIADLEDENADLSGRLASAVSSAEELKDQLLSSSQIKEQTLHTTIENQIRRIAELQEEKSLLSSKLSTIEEAAEREETERLITAIEGLEQEKTDLAGKLSSVKRDLHDHITHVEELQEQLKYAQEQIETQAIESSQKLSYWQGEVERLQSTIEDQTRVIQELKEEKADVSSRLVTAQTSVEEMTRELATQVKRKQDLLLAAQVQQRALQSRIEGLEKEKVEWSIKLSSLEEDLAGRMKETERLQDRLHNGQAQLEAHMLSASDRLSMSQVQLETLQSTIEDQTRAISELKKENDAASKRLIVSQATVDELKRDVATQAQQEEELLLSSQMTQQALQSRIDCLEAEKLEWSVKFSKVEEDLADRVKESEKFQEQVSMGKAEFDAHVQEASSRLLLSQAQVEALQLTTESQTQTIAELKEENADVSNRLSVALASLEDVKRENAIQANREEELLESSKMTQQNLQSKIDCLEKEKVELSTKLSKVEADLADRVNKMSQLQERMRNGQEQLEAQVLDASDQLSLLQAEIGKSQATIETQARTIAELKGEKLAVSDRLLDAEAMVEEVTQTLVAQSKSKENLLSSSQMKEQGLQSTIETQVQTIAELKEKQLAVSSQLRNAQAAVEEVTRNLTAETKLKEDLLASSQMKEQWFQSTIEAQTQAIAQLKEERDRASAHVRDVHTSLEEVNRDLASQTEFNIGLLSSTQGKEEGLQSTIKIQSRTIAELEDENALLSSQLSIANKTMDCDEAEHLRSTIELLEFERIDMTNKLSTLERDIADRTKETAELQDELSILRNSGRQRNEILASLQQENAGLLFLMNKMEKRLIDALQGPRHARHKHRGMEIMPQMDEEQCVDMLVHSPSSLPIGPAPMSDYARYLALQELYECDVAPKTLSPWVDEGIVRARSVSAPSITDIPLSTLVSKVQEQRDAKLPVSDHPMVEGKKSVLRDEPEHEDSLPLSPPMCRPPQLVHFCAFAPAEISKPKQVIRYSVWAFGAHHRKAMLHQAHANDSACSCLSVSDTALLVPFAANVHVTLAVPRGYRIKNGACQSLLWQDDVASVHFDIECTKKAAPGNAAFQTRIAIGGANEAP